MYKNAIEKISKQKDGGFVFGAEYMPTKWSSIGAEIGLMYFSWSEETKIQLDDRISSLMQFSGVNVSQLSAYGVNQQMFTDMLGMSSIDENGIRTRFGIIVRVYFLQ